MDDIDTRIKTAMKDEFSDHDLDFDPGREPGLLAQAMSLFRGRMRWWMVMMIIMQFAFIAAAVAAVLAFFRTDEARMQIFYACGFMVLILATWMMKLWAWMQMNRNVILREIKRLELQIARLRSEG